MRETFVAAPTHDTRTPLMNAEINSGLPSLPGLAAADDARVLSGDFDGDGRTDLALLGAQGWTTMPLVDRTAPRIAASIARTTEEHRRGPSVASSRGLLSGAIRTITCFHIGIDSAGDPTR